MKFSQRRGSAFVIVVSILAIILFASTMFMSSTIEEGRQTSMSVRGLHAASLAEAGLERAMRVITEKINDLNPAELTSDSLAVKLRLPAKVGSGGNLGLADNLGSDEMLELSDSVTQEIVLTKDDLQPDGTSELDDLVAYVTSEGARDFQVEVKLNVEKAFHIAPGNDFSDFKVPGVDISWNLRPDVKTFLEGGGYSPLQIGFPPDMSWLSFSIPISIGGFDIININVAGIVDSLMPEINVGGSPRSFRELTSLDFFAEQVINNVLSGGKRRYPVEIRFDAIPMPTSISDLWPSGVSVSQDNDDYLEKYGQIKLECEASITYKDNYTAKRRVSAVKDFKVADCEPPAPMYSVFIANLNNDRISFNNYGGTFIVNNYDYGGLWTKIKEVFTNSESELTDEELRQREVPGLIRVNYKDPTGSAQERPLVCNVSLVGDWGAPNLAGDDSGFVGHILSGVNAFQILTTKSNMAVAGGACNVNADIVERPTSTSASVPSGMTGSSSGSSASGPTGSTPPTKMGVSLTNDVGGGLANPKDFLAAALGVSGINLTPNIGGMSTNVIALAITMAMKPIGQVLSSSIARVPDCFEKWEMAYMGTSNSAYTIPTAGTGANKTHFFGAGGLYPTLTREVEGNVLKRFRQWKMCIVGMNVTDRLPLLPFPPFVLPPPPIVVPIWYTNEILQKYDYNLYPLKANNESGDPDTRTYEYDPGKLENMPPNLYTLEQYAKKATYYYEDYATFLADIPNRMTTVAGKKVFVLNGITFITGSVGSASNPFNPTEGSGDFYVCGKGMIVCSGNFYLGCNIKTLDFSKDELTVFTLMVRTGGLLILSGSKRLQVEGSVYTDKGLYVHMDSSLRIVGNWVTNQFNKASMGGTVGVDYVSTKVRSSLGSLHPTRGKYDPRRYHVSFSPLWASWRSF